MENTPTNKPVSKRDIYKGRYLSEGYPDLEKLGVDYYSHAQAPEARGLENMACIEKLIDLSNGLRTVLLIGCGPNPRSVKELCDRGYDAIGIEPVEGSAKAAALFMGDPTRIRQASAEALPFPDGSQRVVLMEAVLEHVDSPFLSLTEAYRVLAPGGVLFIATTNRLRFELNGENQEFRTKFFNWFPEILKECYVFQHLHYDPRLANYSPRPAVHWFTYSDLCKLGRHVGFAQFYSLIDLMDLDAPAIQKSKLRSWFLERVKYRPWLKALALTRYGHSIFMLKRK